MSDDDRVVQLDKVVIGAGQVGLAVGYHLAPQGCDFLTLDSNPRVGDTWRKRWDSLPLFTPAGYSGLPGMPFAAPAGHRPTKHETADYMEEYATRFSLPVRPGVSVDSMTRQSDLYTLSANLLRFKARVVVVATGSYQSANWQKLAGHGSRVATPAASHYGCLADPSGGHCSLICNWLPGLGAASRR